MVLPVPGLGELVHVPPELGDGRAQLVVGPDRVGHAPAEALALPLRDPVDDVEGRHGRLARLEALARVVRRTGRVDRHGVEDGGPADLPVARPDGEVRRHLDHAVEYRPGPVDPDPLHDLFPVHLDHVHVVEVPEDDAHGPDPAVELVHRTEDVDRQRDHVPVPLPFVVDHDPPRHLVGEPALQLERALRLAHARPGVDLVRPVLPLPRLVALLDERGVVPVHVEHAP